KKIGHDAHVLLDSNSAPSPLVSGSVEFTYEVKQDGDSKKSPIKAVVYGEGVVLSKKLLPPVFNQARANHLNVGDFKTPIQVRISLSDPLAKAAGIIIKLEGLDKSDKVIMPISHSVKGPFKSVLIEKVDISKFHAQGIVKLRATYSTIDEPVQTSQSTTVNLLSDAAAEGGYRLYSVGWGGYHQLGDGSGGTKDTLSVVTFPGVNPTLKAISPAIYCTPMVIDDHGQLYGWGYNGYGKTGTASTTDAELFTPIACHFDKEIQTKIVSVSSGPYHALALDDKKQLWGAGCSEQNRLTSQIVESARSFTRIAPDMHFEMASAGAAEVDWNCYCSFGISDQGKLLAWGNYIDGGDVIGPTPGLNPTPRPVGSVTDKKFKWVSHNFIRAAAITIDGDLYLWGKQEHSSLLINKVYENSPAPVEIHDPFAGGTVKWKKVMVGPYHMIGLDMNGNVWSWGSNWSGALGQGLDSDADFPPGVVKDLAHDIIDIAVGFYCGAAVASNGDLYVWGSNSEYQIGLSSKKYPYWYTRSPVFMELAARTAHIAFGIKSLFVLAKPS
ncbi:RCC1 domain-containing protein, partial [Chromobacterium vaccinii]|uniref:RCC1 domain-containing protein n=1 Tax=Chromobacterium vaccinii TaxID=1108595 RepID=UPI003C72AA93